MFDVDSTSRPLLSPSGVDFSNETQAQDFLDALLDDTILKDISSDYAFAFWIAVVATVVGFAAFNFLNRFTRILRRRKGNASQQGGDSVRCEATSPLPAPLSIMRMLSYAQIHSPPWARSIKVPSLGVIMLLFAYLGLVLGLVFGQNNVLGAQYWQALGIRAGWLAVAQLPLIVLLAGKRNLISFATGLVYHRLNIVHRWASRIMLLLAIFHAAFQAHGWSQFPYIFHLETTTDACVPTGIAAFALLAWMNLSTLPFFRSACYEFFVVQHILTFFGLIIALMLHLPSTALSSRIYVYVPIGLYINDRLLRTGYYIYVNRKGYTATLTRLPGDVTLVRTTCPKMKSWKAGSHVLISFPGLAFGQSHPATIASTPASHAGEMLFLLRRHKGFTRTLFNHAEQLDKSSESEINIVENSGGRYRILLEGPYGGPQADFSEFSSICLIAGSTGITFVMAMLLDLAHKASTANGNLPFRMVKVVWAVNDSSHLTWVHTELSNAVDTLRSSGVETDVAVFVTKGLSNDAWDSDTSKPQQDFEEIDPEAKRKWYGSAGELSTQVGRPKLSDIVQRVASDSTGDCGIAVCGPSGMNIDVRNAVAGLAARGQSNVFLHVEGFSY